ncbi:biliverdin-producing heme oxygenase [Falsiroseomonas selenitidurans]|uniref:Biliverdin-producing heme oxygenase n=1 Tax=Falsiroseomonas selenitidurans TaxID=2716335 RepID=A0ABX1E6V1_9PROT|nr:biliverdin-producing heme oxygenase [Falsiroseomonas selenitidurans]NKC32661.1 biliverdin-producing heme oxygenase [Falsiroseomonas selenitidurans]
MPGDAARLALRHATGAVHERLHQVPVFARLAAGRIGAAEYVTLLRRLLGFHLGVEAALAAAPSLAPFGIAVEERRRSPLLVADLVALGAAPLAPVAALPPAADAGFAMGCLYVTEGSTLGGQQLARALDGVLPGEAGRSFLRGYGARHGAMWRECCTAIEACGAEAGRLAAMIAGAEATFARFESWFAPQPG